MLIYTVGERLVQNYTVKEDFRKTIVERRFRQTNTVKDV